jgi:hypothetical protein
MEKVMEMIYSANLNLHDDHTIAGRKKRIKELEEDINTMAFGTVGRPGTYAILAKNKTAKIGGFKFNDACAKRMEDALMKLLPLFPNKPDCNIGEWIICLKQMTLVLKKLKQRRYFTDPEMDRLQKEIDKWSHLWIFGG